MGIQVEYTSMSAFLRKSLEEIKKRQTKPGDLFDILITPSSGNFLDLYSMGRLFAFANFLNKQLSFITAMRLKGLGQARLSRLQQLGFFNLCKSMHIPCTQTSALQLRTLQITDAFKKKVYWYCPIPLQVLNFKCINRENDAIAETNQIIETLSTLLRNFCECQLCLDYRVLSIEITRILFGLFRELILNAIVHSSDNKLILALSISCETSTQGRAHRPGITFHPGQPKYEVLVMDLGCGVLDAIQSQLAINGGSAFSDYQHSLHWENYFVGIKEKEEALLKSIFRGNLLIRKGRKSEGLHDLANHISWFGGLLNYRSGRTEVQVSGKPVKPFQAEVRQQSNNYLPGVVASAVLPSHQLRLLSSRGNVKALGSVGITKSAISISTYKHLPKGLFGGQTEIELRQKSELYARELINEYREQAVLNPQIGHLYEINLYQAKTISAEFLDILIQELCKSTSLGESGLNICSRIIFSNAPRHVIHSLRLRNCNSFLMMTDSILLFLDEADAPHFLGCARIGNNVHDVEDCLTAIFLNKGATETDLRMNWGIDDPQINVLRQIITENQDDLFYRETDGTGYIFRAHDVLSALSKNRERHIANLKNCIAEPPKDAIVELDNGSYLDKIIQFSRFWGDKECLFDCSKLILSKHDIPPISTLVSFMHNGDRLAATLQGLLGVSKLIVADPYLPESWEGLAIDSDYGLVIDVLYPGEERGYVARFLMLMSGHQFKAKFVISFADLRDEQSVPNFNDEFVTIPRFAFLTQNDWDLPKLTSSESCTFVCKAVDGCLMPEAQPAERKSAGSYSTSHTFFKYSDIELSAEFWHNASLLGIISHRKTGREKRNILFYENNERIVENKRTRSYLEEFASDFVRDKLQLNIDVILHPTHSVGAFLAQLVANQLNKAPNIIPLRQSEYGGKIDISRNDHAHFIQTLEQYRKDNGQVTLRTLIVDDSIITGSSIFTMLGIANTLGLKVKGILVLLNRLSPEVSSAVDSLPLEFAYLYRLHMPILSDRQSPDSQIVRWSDALDQSESSFFSRLWSQHLRDSPEGSYFLHDIKQINSAVGFTKSPSLFDDFRAETMQPHELKQIIDGLLLHNDPVILDFYTRLAIAYNFLEKLVEEPVFWKLLNTFITMGLDDPNKKNEIHFVRKIIYILAFSRYIRPCGVFAKYRNLCFAIIETCIHRNMVLEFPSLVCDCLMALGAIGDRSLIGFGKKLIPNLSHTSTTSRVQMDYMGRSPGPSLDILSAYAWSVGVLSLIHDVQLDDSLKEQIRDAFNSDSNPSENDILRLDIFQPFTFKDKILRSMLQINEWNEQDAFIAALGSGAGSNEAYKYLINAPSYVFVMKCVLHICRADSVLLLERNDEDSCYYLRAFDSREPIRPENNLAFNPLRDWIPSERIQSRINKHLFFFSDDRDEVQILDKFCKGNTHKSMFGSSVRRTGTGQRYYFVIGYAARHCDESFLRTAFYYWAQCEALLQSVLPAIHQKHVASSTAWNALIHSVRPLHSIEVRDNPRRRLLGIAMGLLDLGDLLRRAVGISCQVAMKPHDILGLVRSATVNIKDRIIQTSVNYGLKEDDIPTEKDLWPITIITTEHYLHARDCHLSFHSTIFEFVLYECLCNALSYYKDSIYIYIDIVAKDDVNGVSSNGVELSIKNHFTSSEFARRTSGIQACKTAANAVGGEFVSKSLKDGLWEANLWLPVFWVPRDLEKAL